MWNYISYSFNQILLTKNITILIVIYYLFVLYGLHEFPII